MIHKSAETQSGDEPDVMVGGDVIRIHGPASLSNLGPGFDAIGLCISGYKDVVEIRPEESPGIRIEQVESDGSPIPLEADQNTASVAAGWVFDQCGERRKGASITIRKGIPFGSGIGGSAASAVAGAWGANIILGEPFTKEELVDAVLEGELVASKGRHGDNVLPALFGGMVLVSSSDPTRYRRITLPRPLPVSIVLPKVQILTHQARAMLPSRVSLRDAVHNAAELAFLIAAVQDGDWKSLGGSIMKDRLVEPVRATLVPCYQNVKDAAIEAGAHGCAITGSGPAMFAISETHDVAVRVLAAMIEAGRNTGIEVKGKVVEANPIGAVQSD